MQNANTISHEATTAVQRAFIYVDDFEVFPERNPDDPTKIDAFTFYPRVKNSGATAALQSSYWVNKWPSAKPIEESFRFPDLNSEGKEVPSEEERITPGFFPPQSAENAAVPLRVPGQVALDVNSGKTHLYLYGWIKYRDTFKDTDPHISMFCSEVKEFKPIAAFNGTPASVTVKMGLCPKQLAQLR